MSYKKMAQEKTRLESKAQKQIQSPPSANKHNDKKKQQGFTKTASKQGEQNKNNPLKKPIQTNAQKQKNIEHSNKPMIHSPGVQQKSKKQHIQADKARIFQPFDNLIENFSIQKPQNSQQVSMKRQLQHNSLMLVSIQDRVQKGRNKEEWKQQSQNSINELAKQIKNLEYLISDQSNRNAVEHSKLTLLNTKILEKLQQQSNSINKTSQRLHCLQKIIQKCTNYQNHSSNAKQLSELKEAKDKIASQQQELKKKSNQNRQIMCKVQINKKLSEEATRKLQEQHKISQKQKLNHIKELEQKLQLYQLKIQQMVNQQQNNRLQQETKVVYTQSIMISSNILNLKAYCEGKDFVKSAIEQFQGKRIQSIELIFQKDSVCSDFGSYIDTKLFPILLLIETDNDVVFGAFSDGFLSKKNKDLLIKTQQKQQNRAFLFNATKKLKFFNEKKSNLRACQYRDSILGLGNDEMYIKNNSLETVTVHAGNIIGECYFNVQHRIYLTGSEDTQIKIRRFEIHRILFKQT